MKRPLIVVGTICLALMALCGVGVSVFLSNPSLRVRRMDGKDPALQAAVRRAQRELPEFLRRLAAARPGERFAVRVRFPTLGEPEFLWVRDPQPIDAYFRGTLDETPFATSKMKKGEEVLFKRADIVDWLIGEAGGKRRGGYTEEALRSSR